MAPQISIIVPVYNVEPYLRQCLNSLVEQTMADIEIICINDCSTDGSLALLREFENMDPRVIVIDKEVNEGLATTRNKGMASASGKYLLFVDSDDYVDPDLCNKVFNRAEQQRADVVIYDYAAFTTDADLRQACAVSSSLAHVDPADKFALLNLNAFAWTKLVRADHLRRLGVSFPDGLLYEDGPFHWELILQTERISLLNERLCYYRQRGNSIGTRTDWKRTDYMLTFDLIKSFLQKNAQYEGYMDFFLKQQLSAFLILYDTIQRSHRPAVLAMIEQRMGREHWEYVRRGGTLDRRTRDFFLSLDGSLSAKLRQALWLAARKCIGILRRMNR